MGRQERALSSSEREGRVEDVGREELRSVKKEVRRCREDSKAIFVDDFDSTSLDGRCQGE